MRPNILHLLSAIAFLRVPLLSFQNQKKKILQISLQFCNTEKNSERFEIFSKLEGWIKAMYRELLSHEIDWVRKPQWEKKDLSSESSEIPFLCVDFIEESDFPSYLLCPDSDSPRFSRWSFPISIRKKVTWKDTCRCTCWCIGTPEGPPDVQYTL